MDNLEVCPNLLGEGVSPKVKLIAEQLRTKIKACILTQPTDMVCANFSLTREELQEFKDNFFRIDPILEMGKPYVVNYLERTNQKALLQYYLLGADYVNYKLGIAPIKDNGELYSRLVTDTITLAIDTEDLDLKLKTIKSIKPDSDKESLLDKLGKKLQEQGIDL